MRKELSLLQVEIVMMLYYGQLIGSQTIA